MTRPYFIHVKYASLIRSYFIAPKFCPVIERQAKCNPIAGNKIICSIRSAIPYAATEPLLVSWVGKKEAKKVIIKKPDAIQSVFKEAGKACVIISLWYLNFEVY